MTVTVEKPEIVTLLYKQEKTDEDYGSCLWARFYFDLKNYTLQIESDCGNYIHGWTPTPKSESFLELCARFDYEYLLYKISNPTIIDGKETWKQVKEFVTDMIEYEILEDDLDKFDWEQLEVACYHHNDERDCFDAICSALDDTELRGKYETECIWSSIVKTYPANAKKIVSVFVNCIQPFIKTMEG